MKYLIINTGSASKKYALYSEGKEMFFIHFEKEEDKIVATLRYDSKEEKLTLSFEDYNASINYLIKLLYEKELIKDKKDIDAVGIRVVAPGTFFVMHRIVDKEYLEKINEAKKQAPLHVAPILLEFEQLKKILPDVHIVGVSDSAFHADRSEVSKYYAIPKSDSDKLELYRYGYHGISIESILSKLKDLLGAIPPRTIICHLGGGSSITAVKNEKNVDTSMGFTPLEGLVMATRVGDIDPGAVIYLAKKLGLDLDELEEYLNNKCGVLGLSGRSDDMRELFELEDAGNKDAVLAVEMFVYRIKKYIGAYAAALGGLDMLIFSATIGERSDIIRRRVCKNMDYLDIVLDDKKNKETISKEGFIENNKSKVKIAIIKTDEMKQMAQITKTFNL